MESGIIYSLLLALSTSRWSTLLKSADNRLAMSCIRKMAWDHPFILYAFFWTINKSVKWWLAIQILEIIFYFLVRIPDNLWKVLYTVAQLSFSMFFDYGLVEWYICLVILTHVQTNKSSWSQYSFPSPTAHKFTIVCLAQHANTQK